MTNFEFKRERAQYKNKKGDKVTISNNTMTDERAIEFLKTNPKRIELFSKFPKGWKKMIKGEGETAEQTEARLAAEAIANSEMEAQLREMIKEVEANVSAKVSAEFKEKFNEQETELKAMKKLIGSKDFQAQHQEPNDGAGIKKGKGNYLAGVFQKQTN